MGLGFNQLIHLNKDRIYAYIGIFMAKLSVTLYALEMLFTLNG